MRKYVFFILHPFSRTLLRFAHPGLILYHMTTPTIELQQGDLTTVSVDAIVNAANSSLLGGGGVDGAIHRAAGPELLAECRRIAAERGPLPAGRAGATGAGELPCRRVIHTVGPVWHGGGDGEAEKLASCYAASLALADAEGLASIAFPNISTGVYGYPKAEAARIAVAAVRGATAGLRNIRRIIFVCWDRENYRLYGELLSLD